MWILWSIITLLVLGISGTQVFSFFYMLFNFSEAYNSVTPTKRTNIAIGVIIHTIILIAWIILCFTVKVINQYWLILLFVWIVGICFTIHVVKKSGISILMDLLNDISATSKDTKVYPPNLASVPKSQCNSAKSIIYDEDDIEDYSFKNYSVSDFLNYIEIELGEGNEEFFKNGLLRVMKLEQCTFEELVRGFKTIRKEYYIGGGKSEVSQQYRLHHICDFFDSYLQEKCARKLSFDRFESFLLQEAKNNKVYTKNKLNDDENIISVIMDGFHKHPLSSQMTVGLAHDILKTLKRLLEENNTTMYWLCNHITWRGDFGLTEWFDKYDDLEVPSLSDMLEWFWHYYKYEQDNI